MQIQLYGVKNSFKINIKSYVLITLCIIILNHCNIYLLQISYLYQNDPKYILINWVRYKKNDANDTMLISRQQQ